MLLPFWVMTSETTAASDSIQVATLNKTRAELLLRLFYLCAVVIWQ